jgi:hypothetical protein
MINLLLLRRRNLDSREDYLLSLLNQVYSGKLKGIYSISEIIFQMKRLIHKLVGRQSASRLSLCSTSKEVFGCR